MAQKLAKKLAALVGQFFGQLLAATFWQFLGPRPRPTGVSNAPPPQRDSERVSQVSKKCPKQSQESLRSLKTDCFETPETLLRLFGTVFGHLGQKAPGDSFGDSMGIWGPKGSGDSCKGQAGPQGYLSGVQFLACPTC